MLKVALTQSTLSNTFLSLKKKQVNTFKVGEKKNLFEALSELQTWTASHGFHGHEKVTQLYADLGGGCSHAACVLPGWLPLVFPDRDHQEIKSSFCKASQKHRLKKKTDNILYTWLDSPHKDGCPLTDGGVVGSLVACSWHGSIHPQLQVLGGPLFGRDNKLQEKCYLE